MHNLVLATLLLFFSAPIYDVSFAGENLLLNPGFEEITDSSPANWKYDRWAKDKNTARFNMTTENPRSGRFAIAMDVSEEDDVKVLQKIAVVPDSIYGFSCWVRAEGIPPNKKGANISVLGILETSEDVHDTKGQWKQIHLYGKTGRDQRELVFTLRLGGYGSLNKGSASFDDCVVENLKNVPKGAKIAMLTPPEKTQKKTIPEMPLRSAIIWLFTASLVFGGVVLFWIFYYLKPDFGKPFKFNEPMLVYGLFGTGFLLKTLLSFNFSGFPVDIITYKAWSDLLAQKGFADFYFSGHFVDYPPLFMYVFYLVGKIRNLFSIGFDSPYFVLLLKMPSLIAELISALIVYRIAKHNNIPSAGIVVALFAFILNPALIINSCLWGQIDSVLAMTIALSLLFLINGKAIAALAAFTCSVLLKPQALMFTPLFIFYFLQRRDLMEFIKSTAVSLALLIIIILPFSITNGPIWLLKIFQNAFVQYPYATLNAFNIYALIGKNWAPVGDKFILSFKIWGTLAIALITSASAFFYLRSKNTHKILFIALFIVLSVFMFSSEMHERYMIPFFLLACIAYVITAEQRLLYIITGYAITNTFNLGYTLALAHQGIYHLNADDLLLRSLSLCNLLLYCYTLKWLWIALVDSSKARNKRVEDGVALGSDGHTNLLKPDLSFSGRDIKAAIGLAIILSPLYFYNLGSTLSPQTYWKPGMDGESFYIDFGKAQDISRLSYYAGIGRGKYRIDVSEDFLKWRTAVVIEQKDIFQWKTQTTNIRARYLSFVTEQSGGMLFEIGFFDSSGKIIGAFEAKPFAVFQRTEGSVKNLFDEQHCVPERPSYRNSMYFDEIYFARNAYEIIHSMEHYENTHPPLGKLFMAGAVRVFGMNPFGWRFAGTLSAVLLITAMFFMGRLLFGNTQYGIITALLMASDFMSFVQGRIATVDIFAVLFIVIMYYFMFRFYIASSNKEPGAFRCLALSGLFFGLGAATKWLCLYAGLGLAAIYFYRIYKDLKSHTFAEETDLKDTAQKKAKGKGKNQPAPKNIRARLLKYLIYGFFFFVFMPAIIYILSYIPFMMLPGPNHDLITVLDLQINMLQYHKSVKGSHPFASTWWQWPLLIKPMWLYMGAELPAGKAASIVSMGNPLIWWSGILSLIYLVFAGFRRRSFTLVSCLIVTGFLSNYIPWVFVPREIYIYHFFASVPFLVLGIVYSLRELSNRFRYILWVYLCLAILLFALFYPILSGAVVDKEYMLRYLKWFKGWIFFLP